MGPVVTRSKMLEQLFEDFAIIKRKFLHEHPRHIPALAHSQWITLGVVFRLGTVTIKELSWELAVSQSAATQLVNALAQKRLVTRVQSASDGRSVCVSLSPSAKKMAKSLTQRVMKNLSEIFSPLSDAELCTYAKLHRRIASNLKS